MTEFANAGSVARRPRRRPSRRLIVAGLLQLLTMSATGAVAATGEPFELLLDDRFLFESGSGSSVYPSAPFADFDATWSMGTAVATQTSSVTTRAFSASGLARGSDGQVGIDIFTPDSNFVIDFRIAVPTRVTLSGYLTRQNNLPATNSWTTALAGLIRLSTSEILYQANMGLFDLDAPVAYESVLPPGDYEVIAAALSDYFGTATYQLEVTGTAIEPVPVLGVPGCALLVTAIVAMGAAGRRGPTRQPSVG